MTSFYLLRSIIFFAVCPVAFNNKKPVERLTAILAFKDIEEFHSQVVERNYGGNKTEMAESEVDSHPIKIQFCRNALRSRIVQQLVRIPNAQADAWISSGDLKWDVKLFLDMEFLDVQPRKRDAILQNPFRFPATKSFSILSRGRSLRHHETTTDYMDNTMMYVTKDASRPPSVSYVGCYVSREYNVNVSASVPHVAGRFFYFVHVRTTNDPDTGTKVYQTRLMATEPASNILEEPVSPTLVENILSQARSRVKPAESAQDDPVCRLKPIVLGQICSTVLNSPYFADMVVEQMNIQGVSCYRERIWFAHETQREIFQWMLNCQTRMRNKETGEEFWYHVSRGRSRNNFFVYVYSHNSAPFPVVRVIGLSSNVIKYYNTNMFD